MTIDVRIAALRARLRLVCTHLLVVLVMLATYSPSAVAEEAPLKLGIFPRMNYTETMALFIPLADYLSESLERPVEIVSTKDFAAFNEMLSQGKFDIVFCNQYDYIKAHKKAGYEAIAKIEELGASTVAGALVARTDSAIHSVADLKGRKIIFGGGKSAMQAYIIPTYLLRKAGLRAGDYGEEFAVNSSNAVVSMYFGDAAAAGTDDRILDLSTLKSKIDVTKTSYLARGEPLAQLPWSVSKRVPAALRAKIQNALTSMKTSRRGPELLNKLHYTGFAAAADSDYDPHRKIVREVLGEEY